MKYLEEKYKLTYNVMHKTILRYFPEISQERKLNTKGRK